MTMQSAFPDGVGTRRGGAMMQQIKLPRSCLKADMSSWVKEESVAVLGNGVYYTTITWGDFLYSIVATTLRIYNLKTKTYTNVNLPGFSSWHVAHVIVGKRCYLYCTNGGFCVLDFETNTVSPLVSPITEIKRIFGSDYNMYEKDYNLIPAMRYDAKYNRIYAFLPVYADYRNTGNNYYYRYEGVCVARYNITNNTWLAVSPFNISGGQGASTSAQPDWTPFNQLAFKRGGLIDFNETTVKFVSNIGLGASSSITYQRSSELVPTSVLATESLYTQLAISSSIYDVTVMSQTDGDVFAITGNKVYKFDLFTGETSDEKLLAPCPAATFTAAYTHGINLFDGKLWFFSGAILYAMDYKLIASPQGPLAWKILKGQKFSALSDILIKRRDGTSLTITTEQQEAAQDIALHIGEYSNMTTDVYLLIET